MPPVTLNQRNAEADAYRARVGQTIEEADFDFVTRLVSWLRTEKGPVNLCQVGANVPRNGAGGMRSVTGAWLKPVLSRDPRVQVDMKESESYVRIAPPRATAAAAPDAPARVPLGQPAKPQADAARLERAPKKCSYFNTLRGCKKGDSCSHLHVPISTAEDRAAHSTSTSKYEKTSGDKECAFFNTRRGCMRGEACPYPHVRLAPPPPEEPGHVGPSPVNDRRASPSLPAANVNVASAGFRVGSPSVTAFLDDAEKFLRSHGEKGTSVGLLFSELGNAVRKPPGAKGFAVLFSSDPLARFEIIGSGVTARVRLSSGRQALSPRAAAPSAAVPSKAPSFSASGGGGSAGGKAVTYPALPQAPKPVRAPDVSASVAKPGIEEFRNAAAIFLEACGGEHGPSILISKLGKDIPKPRGAPSIISILSADPDRRFEVFSGQQGREAVRLRALARVPGSVVPVFPVDMLNPEEDGYYVNDTEQEYTAALRLSRMSN